MGADERNIGCGGRIVQGGRGVAISVTSRSQEVVFGGFGHHDFGGVARKSRPHGLRNEIVENLAGPNTRLVGHSLIRFVLRRDTNQRNALALAIIGVIEKVLGIGAIIRREKRPAVIHVVIAFPNCGRGPFGGPDLRAAQAFGLIHDL
jgi:hypothetical protein